jgi:signal peptidase I
MAGDVAPDFPPMSLHSPEPTSGDPERGDPGTPGRGPSPAGHDPISARGSTPSSTARPAAAAGDDTVAPARRGVQRQQRTKRRQRQIIEWVVLIACALGIALVIKTFLFQAFYIPSTSMTPTLEVGDRVLVNKLSYHLHDVHRGDIVVFTAPPGTETAQIKDLVKRVVGLPGETIEGRADGHVYIDGRLLNEPYLHGVASKTFPAERVPALSYFVLGDNRPSSKDSTVFHAISRSKIVGRVFVRIWPLGRLGFL